MTNKSFIIIVFILIIFFASCSNNESPLQSQHSDEENLQILDRGTYSIIGSVSNKALDGRGFTTSGSPLLQWEYNSENKNQKWQIFEHKENYYKIANINTDMFISLNQEGESIIQSPSLNTDEQLWKIIEKTPGLFVIQNKVNGRVLDNLSRVNDGARISMSNFSNSENELWILNHVDDYSEIQLPVEGVFMDLNEISKNGKAKNLKSFQYDSGELKILTNKVYKNDPMIIFSTPEKLNVNDFEKKYSWFTLEMSSTKGVCGWLIADLKGANESRGITIPLESDGKTHRYAIDLSPLYEAIRGKYSGNIIIEKWGLIVTDQGDSQVVINSMSFGTGPMGKPMIVLDKENINLEEILVDTDTFLELKFKNIGGEKTEAKKAFTGDDDFQIPSLYPGEKFTVSVKRNFKKPGINFLEVKIEGQDPINFEIIAYEKPDSNNYIPVPVPAESDYLIGTFNYSGWFDFSKWEPILPFLDRKPLLGWHREDDPIAMDWQIKWAVENGISFFTFNWYRTKGTDSDPVGVAQGFNDALYKALPNARYKNMIKYSLMWNNNNNHPVKTGAKDKDEFLNILVPYWMENHFLKSNYLIIDNKPVFYIWQVKEFIDQMGGINQAKEAIISMNEYAKGKGFDGVYLIGNYVYSSPAHQESYSIGIDNAYYYIAPVNSNSSASLVSQQKSYLDLRSSQAEAAGMKWIPSVSVGWDSLAWYLKNKNRWISTPDEFADILKMNKDYVDSKNYGRKEERIIMLSVWNEYGEGHYIMPTNKYGFEYLDGVRKVFTKSQEINNLTPFDIGIKVDQIVSPHQERQYRIIDYWSLDD